MSTRRLHDYKTSTLTEKSDLEPYIFGEAFEDQLYSELQPEEYSSSGSYISWQHFPKSTSPRSQPCEDSVVTLGKTPSEPTVAPPVKEESLRVSSTEYPITKSFAQLNALHYLEIRHVFELLNFMMSHLVCKEPEDPVEFLVELLRKCLSYRDCLGEPPLLFTSSHIQSLYRAFDPFGRGFITEEQYHEAMKSLGLEKSITPYNRMPTLNAEGFVDETYFLFEAERCLNENLKSMIRIPKIWEENRLVWKKRMRKEAAKAVKTEKSCGEMDLVLGEEETFNSSGPSIISDNYPKCREIEEVNCQLEQLFLN